MRHITHNSSNNSSLSSHNYLLLNQSKKSSIGEGSINIYKNDYNNKQNIKGTLKVNKVNFLTKCQSQKLFEDINIQYIEPLEGGEEESEEQDDGTYRRYLNNIKEELNQKKENIVFINDLGLSNNRLNVNDLFDKIKKRQKFKPRNSFLSVAMINKRDEDIINKELTKKSIPIKRYFKIKDIPNLIIPKGDLKKYIKIGTRTITYDNRKNLNYYFCFKDILLNIREKKKSVRKIKSQKLFKKFKKRQISQNIEADIFGNKKNNKIKDSFSLLDSSKKSSKVFIEEKKEDELEIKVIVPQKEEKKEEKKEEIKNESPKETKKVTHRIKKKKKKKTIVPKKNTNIVNKNSLNLLYKNKLFQKKGTTTTIISNRINPKKIKSKLKSPAINSILKDIRDLSQSILTSRTKQNKEKKDRTFLYDKHFGYEYWKENEIRKLCYHSNSNRKNKSFRVKFSPNKDPEAFSQMSSNFSRLFSNNNYDDIPDYETDFSFGNKNISLNPYSINWTKNMIQNNYNRKIKLKNCISGIPKIELIRVQSAMPYRNKEQIIYNQSKLENEFYRNKNNMFGRIYKNNEVQFPVIKNF